MKITTYSPDGSIKSEEVVKVNIPDYLKAFNGEYPILNVTDEEKHLVNSREESFAKTLLMDRLKAILGYDYGLYKESLKKGSSGGLLNGLCSDIREIEELLTLESIQPNPWYKKVRNAASKVEKSIESIEDHRDDANYTFRLTFDILTLLEAISVYANKMYHFITENGADRFSFDVIRLIEGLYSERKCLDLFKKRMFKFDDKNLSIDCSAFSGKLIKELYSSIGISRETVYAVVAEIESLVSRPVDLIGHSVLAFSSPVIQKMPDPTYTLVLSNRISKENVSFGLKLSELTYIQSDTNALALQTIRQILEGINTCYIGAFSGDWKDDITTLSDTFVHNHKEFDGNWIEYEKHYRSSLKPQDDGKPYTPQDCYKKLVATNNPDSQKNDITFTGRLIQGLLWILFDLKERNDNDQQGLYETIYKFNYIKSKIRDLDNPLTRIRMYLEPIYDNADYVKPSKKSEIEHLITNIFDSLPIDVLTQEKPNGFKGGFNLTLVYNVLGYLQATGVLHGDGKNLDKYLGGKYSEANNIDFKERKHYINDYSISSFFRQNKSTLEHHVKKYITPQN